MEIKYFVFSNLYQDSVALMQLSSKINSIEGIIQSSVIMGTEANLNKLLESGFIAIDAKPNDLVIAVKGENESCNKAITFAKEVLLTPPINEKSEFNLPKNSLILTKTQLPEINLALISVPGEYATAEAIKALHLGLNVMMFSDNISLEDEKYIKDLAIQKELLVMGPDCGTAIINGIPLGFANMVRKGNIGIIAASGTGLQEVVCRVDQLGAGISQALGTGGHDLHQYIGGISMKYGLQLLAEDENTEIIVLISKPPAIEVSTEIITLAKSINKPIVIHFLGEKIRQIRDENLYFAETLSHSADIAVAILHQAPILSFHYSDFTDSGITLQSLTDKQKYIRAVFSGGTFCYEAQYIMLSNGISFASNTPISGGETLLNPWYSQAHTFLDLGDDFFTQGCPHPMIDPTLRNQRILQEGLDPETAVILFDIVLGYGANRNPITELLDIITQIQLKNANPPYFIAHICGTEQDIQDKKQLKKQLQNRGVIIAKHNADAAYLALKMIK